MSIYRLSDINLCVKHVRTDDSPRDNCRLLFPVPVSDTFYIYELTVWPLEGTPSVTSSIFLTFGLEVSTYTLHIVYCSTKS